MCAMSDLECARDFIRPRVQFSPTGRYGGLAHMGYPYYFLATTLTYFQKFRSGRRCTASICDIYRYFARIEPAIIPDVASTPRDNAYEIKTAAARRDIQLGRSETEYTPTIPNPASNVTESPSTYDLNFIFRNENPLYRAKKQERTTPITRRKKNRIGKGGIMIHIQAEENDL